MKRLSSILFALAGVCGFVLSSHAQTDTVIINDTWADGNRTSVGPDGGGIDSTWYASAAAQTTVPAAGDLRFTVPAGSLFNTTYFPSGTSPYGNQAVTLVNPGDELSVSWTFTLTGTSPTNANQNFVMAVVNTPGAHLTTQAAPAQEVYAGYATFMNMGQVLSGATGDFALKEWTDATATSLLGSSGAWGANGTSGGNLALDGTGGNTGFADSTTYTYLMTLTLGNSGDLLINNSITGGSLNNVGFESVSYDDTTPNSLTFDTFGVREGTSSATAGQFDTSNFKVDFITTAPEPTILALSGLGLMGLAGYRRLRR